MDGLLCRHLRRCLLLYKRRSHRLLYITQDLLLAARAILGQDLLQGEGLLRRRYIRAEENPSNVSYRVFFPLGS